MSESTSSTYAHLGPESDAELRRRRVLYSATTTVLAIVMALGVTDAFGWTAAYGVESGRVAASGGGYRLEVQYPQPARPALASPFQITVTADDGTFEGPVTIAVERDYLKLWDENGLVPAPSGERSQGEWVEWEFDPPDAGPLTVSYDARIEPAAQSGRDGAVAVIDDGAAVVTVEFRTEVRP